MRQPPDLLIVLLLRLIEIDSELLSAQTKCGGLCNEEQ